MSSEPEPSSAACPLDLLLAALPLAGARVALTADETANETAAATGAPAGRSLAICACNAAWQALWEEAEPDLARPGGLIDQARLGTIIVDPAAGKRLIGGIAEGTSLALTVAVDLAGPGLLDAWGSATADGYLLLLRPVTEPERVALDWPGDPARRSTGRGFRYLAALGADGSWRVSAASPAYRQLLGLPEDGSASWLGSTAPEARRALRSRHLALLAGKPQRLAYRLRRQAAPGVLLDDTAEPLRHPATGEVIGIVGRVRLVADTPVLAASSAVAGPAAAAPEADAPPVAGAARETKALQDGLLDPGPEPGLEPSLDPGLDPGLDWADLVAAIEALGSPAALFDGAGRLVVAGAEASALLTGDTDTERAGPTTLGGLLDTDQAMTTRLLASLEADGMAISTTEAGLDLPLPAGRLAGPAASAAPEGWQMRLRLLTLGRVRHVLAIFQARSGHGLAGAALSVRDALYFDPATSLPNRFLFLDRLRQTLVRNAASGGSCAVLVVEIPRLPLIERSFGRAVADGLAASLAARFVGCRNGLTTTARLEEGRFGVIADDLAGSDDAARIAQTLLEQLQVPLTAGGREIGVAGKVGIAVFPYDGNDAATLLDQAEAAAERLQPGQSPAYQFHTSAMNTAASDRLMLEQQLLRAIREEQFVLVYQPQISLATSRIVGMEALIRWRHPELGMVPPGEFIPLAEETGAIVAIGEWVVRAACRELMTWFAEGVPTLRLAINVSGRQYNDANLVPGIERILEETGFPPHLLELELTETVIMEDVVDAARRLGDLHRLGINLAVDDFGTGYSSLSYLKRFPIHSLKLDRSFVRDIAHDESSASIARAIIAFGSALGLKVIAEGVEAHDQYDILRAAGCDELQGYLFSRPVPPEDARRLASERRHLSQMRP